MGDIPPGWAVVVAAIITGPLVYVLIRILGRLKKVEADTTVTKFHVANEHVDGQGDPINLRDDNDQKHAETLAAVAEVARDIGGIRGELRNLRDVAAEQTRQANRDRDRIDRLEDTRTNQQKADRS